MFFIIDYEEISNKYTLINMQLAQILTMSLIRIVLVLIFRNRHLPVDIKINVLRRVCCRIFSRKFYGLSNIAR